SRPLSERIKGALAQLINIKLAPFRDRDDLAGDELGYRITPIGELKRRQSLLIGRGHALDRLGLEHRLANQSIDGHGRELRQGRIVVSNYCPALDRRLTPRRL